MYEVGLRQYDVRCNSIRGNEFNLKGMNYLKSTEIEIREVDYQYKVKLVDRVLSMTKSMIW